MHRVITTPLLLGEIVRQRRMSHRLSQAAVAAKLGISQTMLSHLERDPGSFTLARLIAIANILGLELTISDRSDQSAPETEW